MFVLIGAGLARAADPADLYRYVGRDVGVCVELVDLAKVWPEVRNSDWFARLRDSVVAKEWTGSADFQKLRQTGAAIELALQQPLVDLLGDLFGQRTVLAITPTDAGPAPLLITRARNAEALQSALSKWDRLEPASKEPRTTASGKPYVVRIPRQKAGQTVSYAIVGDLLLLSSSEPELQRSLDRTEGLVTDEQFVSAYRTLRNETAVRLYVRLRAWDRQFDVDAGLTAPDAGRRLVSRVWKASHSLVVGVEPQQGLTFDAHLFYDPQASPAWQSFVAQAQGPVTIFQRIPGDALAAFGGKLRWTWIDAAVRDLTPPEKLPEWEQLLRVVQGLCLGHDPVQTIAASLSPETCTYVVPGSSNAPEWAPLDAVVAFKQTVSRPAPGPTVAEAFHNALRTGLNVLAAVRNAEGEQYHAVVKTRDPGELGITWLHGLAAWQPGFASTAAHLVLASSPEAIDQFLWQDATSSLATQPAFRNWVDRECPQAGQIAIINVHRVRDWFKLHGLKLARHLNPNLTEEHAHRRLTRLDELLEPIQALGLAVQLEPRQARLVFSIAVEGK